jgi:hypothetical protein
MTKTPIRTRQVVVEELATASVDLAEIALRVGRLTGELAGIDGENRKAAMLRSKPDPLYLPIKVAAGLAGLTPASLKPICKAHGFGWRRPTAGGGQGHWIVLHDDFMEWLKDRGRTARRGPTQRKPEVRSTPR